MENEENKRGLGSLGRWIWIIHRHIRIYIDHHLEDHDMGSGQVSFFMELSREDGISQEQLSERLEVDKATTARAIRKLLDLGYVERRRDERDRRAYCLFLTKRGQELIPVLREKLHALTRQLSIGFSDQEREQAQGYLERMAGNICGVRSGGNSV